MLTVGSLRRHSDKVGERFFHIAIPLFVGIIGFIIAVSTMNTAARYISLYVPFRTSHSHCCGSPEAGMHPA